MDIDSNNDFLDNIDIYSRVEWRLQSLGYTPKSNDRAVIEYTITKISNHVKNTCNIAIIPKKLETFVVDLACADILREKRNTHQLADEELDKIIKSIQEGDTSVTYEIGQEDLTPVQKFDNLLKSLDKHKNELITFRRIAW